MIFENKKISIRQTQALFISEVFGVAVVFMPAAAWGFLGGGALLALAAAVGALALSVFAITSVYGGGYKGFGDMVYKSFGKVGGNVVMALFWLKLIIVSGIWLKEFGITIHSTMLDSVPYQFICAVIAVSCFVLGQRDMEVRGRTAEIFIVIMALLFVPVLILVGLGADYGNVMEIKSMDIETFIKTVFVIFASLGSADYLWFLYPETNMGKSKKELVKAVVITGAGILVTMTVVFATFGDAIGERPWAVLRMMDTVDFPGAFVERQDVLMLGFWIMSLFIYISGAMTYGTYLFKELTGRTNFFLTGVLIFAISVIAFPVEFDASEIMLITTPVFLVVLPFVLLAVRRIRRI
ncbi:MAG: GerAB/ArcD/ProY family transporter [Firmicutes bacterium]|nr:GerAB/ArcD/ProY family transporter [Bacillota bacterium]